MTEKTEMHQKWLEENENQLPKEIEDYDMIDLDVAASVGVLLAETEPRRKKPLGLGSLESHTNISN